MSATLDLTCDLIRKRSVTPNDNGCLDMIATRLTALGFVCQTLPFDNVSNLWAVNGSEGPLLVFAGHTDVVPSGPETEWKFPPFEPTVENGMLYGRGAADMKGSLAAMVVACEKFFNRASNSNTSINNASQAKGRVGFLLTSDEEGIAVNGTVKVMQWLQQNDVAIDYCIIGEPTSSNRVGDTIKNGRRGSLNLHITIIGQQGHIAYPQLAKNPIHNAAPALAELCSIVWDNGNDYFPATSFQISNINGGTGATNVIPGTVDVVANFRFSTEVTAEQLQQQTEAVLQKHQLNYNIEWQLSGQPFLTPKGKLTDAVSTAIKLQTGIDTELSTSGGTSDGRFIAPYGVDVIELGPVNATIHKINECVAVADLDDLTEIYYHCLKNFSQELV